jgi:hypothetical protein
VVELQHLDASSAGVLTCPVVSGPHFIGRKSDCGVFESVDYHCVGARLFAEFQQQGWVFGEVAGRRSLPDGQMLVQLGALFFTTMRRNDRRTASPRISTAMWRWSSSVWRRSGLVRFFRGEWCYCSRYCSGILEACCLQPNGMSLGEILSGWRDLNSRPLDPQIGPLRMSSVNHCSLMTMVDR